MVFTVIHSAPVPEGYEALTFSECQSSALTSLSVPKETYVLFIEKESRRTYNFKLLSLFVVGEGGGSFLELKAKIEDGAEDVEVALRFLMDTHISLLNTKCFRISDYLDVRNPLPKSCSTFGADLCHFGLIRDYVEDPNLGGEYHLKIQTRSKRIPGKTKLVIRCEATTNGEKGPMAI